MQKFYRLNLSDTKLSPAFVTLLKGLLDWELKTRASLKDIIKEPIIFESLKAWQQKEKSETYKKRNALVREQALKLFLL